MARSINRLSALGTRKQTPPGLYHDGGGLYLQVGSKGSKSRTSRYMLAGQAREMGQGPFRIVSLAGAREKAAEAQLLAVLDRMGRRDITARVASTRRSETGRQSAPTSAEMALAHTIANKVEAAYRRGDLFDKRRKLMDAWARHCEQRATIGELLAFRTSATTALSSVNCARAAGSLLLSNDR